MFIDDFDQAFGPGPTAAAESSRSQDAQVGYFRAREIILDALDAVGDDRLGALISMDELHPGSLEIAWVGPVPTELQKATIMAERATGIPVIIESARTTNATLMAAASELAAAAPEDTLTSVEISRDRLVVTLAPSSQGRVPGELAREIDSIASELGIEISTVASSLVFQAQPAIPPVVLFQKPGDPRRG
ncbi:MAG TPA: hypothetical protein VIP55_04875 [Agromyces sp.]